MPCILQNCRQLQTTFPEIILEKGFPIRKWTLLFTVRVNHWKVELPIIVGNDLLFSKYQSFMKYLNQIKTNFLHDFIDLTHSKNLNSLKPHINETENRLKVRNYGLFQQKMQTQNGRGIVRTRSCWPQLLRSLKALLYPDFSLYKLRVNRRTIEIQQPPYILMLNYSFKRFLQVRISQVLIRSFFHILCPTLLLYHC